ncbi:hypothetical protein AB1K89_00940 [Sporosarcina sp. 179-K 8C2 HS]
MFLTIKPVHVNGAEMIMTQDQHGLNLVQFIKMEVVEIGRGKIGEFVHLK